MGDVPVIEGRGLTKHYGEIVGIEDLDLVGPRVGLFYRF